MYIYIILRAYVVGFRVQATQQPCVIVESCKLCNSKVAPRGQSLASSFIRFSKLKASGHWSLAQHFVSLQTLNLSMFLPGVGGSGCLGRLLAFGEFGLRVLGSASWGGSGS